MFPFRFKLTLLISVLIAALLAGIFSAIQNVLEKEFVEAIHVELAATDHLVYRLMEERRYSLSNQATILAGDRVIGDILTDSSIDRATANDIVTEEVLPSFPALVTISVISRDGKLLGTDPLGGVLADELLHSPFFKPVLGGETTVGHLFFEDVLLQYMGMPIFLGDELIGTLFASMALDRQELARIKDLSGAEILLLRNAKPFISTDWSMEPEPRTLLVEQLASQLSPAPVTAGAIQIKLMDERFLYIHVQDEIGFISDHLISISLDKKLAFSRGIYTDILIIGLIGIFIAIILSFLFARSISKPILQLRALALDVEKENYASRVAIRSNDEFSQLGDSFNEMMQGLEERERMRGIMNKVVSREIADVMLKGHISLGGEIRNTSILFADIRNFTALSEKKDPQELLDFLNSYFTRASQCIDNRRGVIDKYIGDALMALFGVPVEQPDNACDAVQAALDLVESQQAFNREHAAELDQPLSVGIGINTGEVIAGNMGAQNRLNYTVLGDEVNLASRLEGLTKYYGVSIIISESTRLAMQSGDCSAENVHRPRIRMLDCVQVKGKTEGIKVYQVFSRQASQFSGLDEQIDIFAQAHDLMLQQEFSSALKLFDQLVQQWPEDGPAKVFGQRCRRYLASADLFDEEYQGDIFIQDSK